jgi:hypothetical protein
LTYGRGKIWERRKKKRKKKGVRARRGIWSGVGPPQVGYALLVIIIT